MVVLLDYTILYYQYHNKKLCNVCFQNKFGYTIKGDLDLSTGVNDDPLGMKIIIYKKL